MEVIRDETSCPRPPEGTAVTIGAYDGLHVGHRAVIAELRARATAQGLRSAVVTFDRHPAAVVRPASAPKLITDLEQKLEVMATTGVDYCVLLRFDEERSRESASEFVRNVLVGCLNARVVAVGVVIHFGRAREGDVELLQKLGAEMGFEVDGVDLVDASGHPSASDADRVSSTRIRAALARGDVAEAGRLLGREHEVRGTVVGGDRRGRELGFPTANLAVPEEIRLPADGIYAAWYERPDGAVLPAAVNLGRRPTFYDDQPYSLLEAHLLDFDGDLYGEAAKVRFVARLRGEVKFDSIDSLVAQMHRDCDQAHEVLRSPDR
jgi:riboflavin kinase / FMN adenylyltransferase